MIVTESSGICPRFDQKFLISYSLVLLRWMDPVHSVELGNSILVSTIGYWTQNILSGSCPDREQTSGHFWRFSWFPRIYYWISGHPDLSTHRKWHDVWKEQSQPMRSRIICSVRNQKMKRYSAWFYNASEFLTIIVFVFGHVDGLTRWSISAAPTAKNASQYLITRSMSISFFQ